MLPELSRMKTKFLGSTLVASVAISGETKAKKKFSPDCESVKRLKAMGWPEKE